LHNARSRYDAFYPEREQAGSSGLDAELMPKVDNVPAIGHSGAFCANETDTNAGAATTAAKPIAFDARIKNRSLSLSAVRASRFPSATLIWIKEADLDALTHADVDFRRDAGPATTLTQINGELSLVGSVRGDALFRVG
jgi:hypothetical protein